MAQLTFLGAARTVTGPKYLLEHGGRRVLCGLVLAEGALRALVSDRFGWQPYVPLHGERMDV